MAKRGGTLQLIAAKSGLGAEEKVLSKAAEYERRLKMKSTTSSNISDMAKSVFCLDFAAAALSVEYDIKTLIKSSGLKPSQYANYKKLVENLLELSCDKLTVALLCAQLHCDTAQEVAAQVLQRVQKSSKMEMDLDLPQYICMAVYQACRINKIKVSKSKFVEKSRLKPGQWSKMEAEWTKIVDQHFAVVKKKGRKATRVVDEEDLPEKMEVDNPVPKQDNETDPPVEPYEHWKRRILAAAHAALEKQVTTDSQVNDNKHKKKTQTNEKHRQHDGQENEKGLKNRQANDRKQGKRSLFDDDREMSDTNYQESVKSPQKKLIIDLEKHVNKRNNQVNDDRRQSPRKKKVSDSQVNDSPRRIQANEHLTDSPRQLTRRGQANDEKGQTSQVTDLPRQFSRRRQANDKEGQDSQITDSPRQMARRQANDKPIEIADDLEEQMIKIVGSPIKIKTYKNKNKIEDVEMRDVKKTEKPVNKTEIIIKHDQNKPIILSNDIFNLSSRRSPRKTPQKYEPYKSPTKTKGVRLLFPCD